MALIKGSVIKMYVSISETIVGLVCIRKNIFVLITIQFLYDFTLLYSGLPRAVQINSFFVR